MYSNQPITEIQSLDQAFKTANELTEAKFARFVLNRIERLAKEFANLKIEGTDEPIVVPE